MVSVLSYPFGDRRVYGAHITFGLPILPNGNVCMIYEHHQGRFFDPSRNVFFVVPRRIWPFAQCPYGINAIDDVIPQPARSQTREQRRVV